MKEVDEKYLKKMYFYILKAVIILLYFFILNAAYENVESGKFQLAIQILTMIFLFIAIYLFEKSYKQDDGEMAINGIEVLILSAYTLTTDHITNKFGFNFKIYSLVASYLYSIYFVMRAIIEYTKGRKELAQNLSDIKEIVKKEEPIKKEATKRTKKEETTEQEIKSKTEKEETTKKVSKAKTEKEKNTKKEVKSKTKKDEPAKKEAKSKNKKEETIKKETKSKTEKEEPVKKEVKSKTKKEETVKKVEGQKKRKKEVKENE